MIPRVWIPALCGILAATLTLSPVPVQSAGIKATAASAWSTDQYSVSMQRIQQSILPNGAIYASPSTSAPNYYYFWVRDGALTMDALASQLQSNPTTYAPLFERFISFTRTIQATPNPSNGPGEPKFNLDGTAFTSPWGRPQNDGPAIRAFALTKYLNYLRSKNPNADVSYLYNGDLTAQSPIKTDLEYVSHHWGETGFEIWEEVRGNHFYTRLVQHKALKEGAVLAAQLGDTNAAAWYKQQADAIATSLNDFWDSSRNFILTTIGRDAGLDYKASNIDNQVILASLHAGDEETGLFAPWDDRVLATAKVMIDTFRPLYSINAKSGLPPAIGRYPEDRYDGVGTTGGNPWVLNTLAHAEILYRSYLQWAKTGSVAISNLNANYFNFVLADSGVGNGLQVQAGQTLSKGSTNFSTLLNAVLTEGDRFLQLVQLHTPTDHNLTEQWNRDTGFAQGARELTWSHTAFTTALRASQAAHAVQV